MTWIDYCAHKACTVAAAAALGLGLCLPRISQATDAPVMTNAAAKALAAEPPAADVTLGKALFNDTTLSTPRGMSCATCHNVGAGFTFPNSTVNKNSGPVAGIVPGRFGNRLTPTISYAVYLPMGTPTYSEQFSAFAGGLFWDGRATDLTDQATFPFQNANEMNNLTHNLGDPALVVKSLQNDKNAPLFMAAYGKDIFTHPTAEVFEDICREIAAFESSREVSPFSSKYDAYLAGKATLTGGEMEGLRLLTGSQSGRPGGKPHKFAQCTLCHGIPSDRSAGLDIFTNSCYANIGVPKNPNNPFYKMIDEVSNPAGYNVAGAAYIDLGLGAIIYPKMGLPPGNMGKGNNGQGDFLAINGTFKAPTLRNVDKRPSKDFVKAYMHNGVFKSLYQVVHFYNTRNLTVYDGEIIDFTKSNPYEGLRGARLFPTPEFPSAITLQNPNGGPASAAAQVGNLGLTHGEEDNLVDFLKTLSDGYFKPE